MNDELKQGSLVYISGPSTQ